MRSVTLPTSVGSSLYCTRGVHARCAMRGGRHSPQMVVANPDSRRSVGMGGRHKHRYSFVSTAVQPCTPYSSALQVSSTTTSASLRTAQRVKSRVAGHVATGRLVAHARSVPIHRPVYPDCLA
eukprot:1782478-Prymnesium_polylepis.1